MNRGTKALLAALALLVTFAGCAPSGDAPKGDATSAPPSNSAQQGASAEPKGDDKGETKGENKGDTGATVQRQKMVVATAPDITLRPEMWIFQEMEKKTGLNFDFEVYVADQWTERKSLLFASNELPDVIAGPMAPADIITYSQAKQLQPLRALLEANAPTYMGLLEKFPDKAKLYAPDGEMYGISSTFTGGYAETPGARSFINRQWVEKLGLQLPKTYDEFYAALVAMRDGNPTGEEGKTVYPLSGCANGYQTVDPFVANPLGLMLQGSKKTEWQVVDGKLQHLVEMPLYTEYLTRMKKLYDEKLLDNEYFTQNEAQFRSKGANMQLGAYTDYAHFIAVGSTDPALYGQYDVAYPMTSDKMSKPVWYGDSVMSPSIFITSANQNPDVTLRYFDYLYTEEGAELICGPEEGKWDGEGGIKWNEDHTKFSYVVPEGFNGIWEWLCKETSIVSIFQGNMQYSEIKGKEIKSPEDAAFKDQMAERVAPHIVPEFPTLFFTTEEQEKISLIMNDVTTYFNQMEAKIIMGEEPLESVTATHEYLKSIGLEDLKTVYQAAYDRYTKNMQ